MAFTDFLPDAPVEGDDGTGGLGGLPALVGLMEGHLSTMGAADDGLYNEQGEMQLVELDENAQTPDFPEHQNLALTLTDADLQKIASRVREEFDEDFKSSQDWRDMVARWRKLYQQQDEPHSQPWPGSSTESIPLITEGVNQFRGRATKVMFPSTEMVSVVPTGNSTQSDVERAERVAKHMSWQLLVQDKNYKKEMKRMAQMVALEGSFFRKIYRDPTTGRNVTRNVPARFLVCPYGDGPRDIEDLTRKTEIVHISTNETRKRAARNYFTRAAQPYSRSSSIQDDDPVKDANDSATGLQEPADLTTMGMSKLLEWHGFLDLDGDGIEEPYIVVLDAADDAVLRVSQRWQEDDPNKEPVEHYEHYYFLENADGFYGLGMGFLLEKMNTAVNRMLRQSIDAATLKNQAGGFIDSSLAVQTGEIRWQMGKFVKVDAHGHDLRSGILAMNEYFSGVDQGLVALMDSIVNHAQRLAMTTDLLAGQVSKVLQPTTILALIEQGLQQFTAAQENILDSWTGELRKLYRLNSLYLDAEEYFTVQDERGNPKLQQVYAEDYQGDMQVIPMADPTMATQQQKIAKAQAMMQALQAGMSLQLPYRERQILEHLRRYYQAFDIKDVDSLLPVPETPLLRDDNPRNENFYAMLPGAEIPAVHWDQDHDAHWMEHTAFLQDPEFGQRLDPEGRAQMERHIKTHEAMRYAHQRTNMQELLKNVDEDKLLEHQQADTVLAKPAAMPGEGGGLESLAALAGQLGGEEGTAPGALPGPESGTPEGGARASQEMLGAQMGGAVPG